MAQSRKVSKQKEPEKTQLERLQERREELAKEFKEVAEVLTATQNQQQQRLGAITLLDEQIKELIG